MDLAQEYSPVADLISSTRGDQESKICPSSPTHQSATEENASPMLRRVKTLYSLPKVESKGSLKSSTSSESVNQVVEDDQIHQKNVRFEDGSSTSIEALNQKWNASSSSLNESEENVEVGGDAVFKRSSQFPRLIEHVRLKEGNFLPFNQKERSSSSSSIGKASEESLDSSDDCSGVEMEVESRLSGTPSQLNLSSLEDSLPVKRGLSSYYNGKSKSFASGVAMISSLAELGKPENCYNKRRRVASVIDSRKQVSLSRPNSAGITKRPPKKRM